MEEVRLFSWVLQDKQEPLRERRGTGMREEDLYKPGCGHWLCAAEVTGKGSEHQFIDGSVPDKGLPFSQPQLRAAGAAEAGGDMERGRRAAQCRASPQRPPRVCFRLH